ncbi:hypothetical protein BGZ88_000848 [Linnemannia elongata]|nr:hypothetical protein BGZ88_000848 [Linnemannia elongata]
MSASEVARCQRLQKRIIDLSRHIASLEETEHVCLSLIQTQTANGVRVFNTNLAIQQARDNLYIIRQQICGSALEHYELIQTLRQMDINLGTLHSVAVSNKMVERLEQLRFEERAYQADTNALRAGNQQHLQNTSYLIKKVADYFANDPYKYKYF